MMRRGRQILAAILLLAVMCACTETTVLATEPDAAEQTEELSEEQKAEQAAYEMKVESNDWKNWPQGPGTYGEAAIVMEVGTGAILYAKNIDSHQYPASITKVLTALVALENGQLEDPVTFSHDSVAFLQPGDSSVGLKEGNQISLEQALHATVSYTHLDVYKRQSLHQALYWSPEADSLQKIFLHHSGARNSSSDSRDSPDNSPLPHSTG